MVFFAIDDKRANVSAVRFEVGRATVEIDGGIGSIWLVEFDGGLQSVDGIEVHCYTQDAVAGQHNLWGFLLGRLQEFGNVLLWGDGYRDTYIIIIVPEVVACQDSHHQAADGQQCQEPLHPLPFPRRADNPCHRPFGLWLVITLDDDDGYLWFLLAYIIHCQPLSRFQVIPSVASMPHGRH